jgi:hypothetical protein
LASATDHLVFSYDVAVEGLISFSLYDFASLRVVLDVQGRPTAQRWNEMTWHLAASDVPPGPIFVE